MFLDIHVEKGGEFVQDIPDQYNGFAYVWRGEGKLGPDEIPAVMGQVRNRTECIMLMSLCSDPSPPLPIPST